MSFCAIDDAYDPKQEWFRQFLSKRKFNFNVTSPKNLANNNRGSQSGCACDRLVAEMIEIFQADADRVPIGL